MKFKITGLLLILTVIVSALSGFGVFADTYDSSDMSDYGNAQELVDVIAGKKVLDKRSADMVSRMDYTASVLKLMDIAPGTYDESYYKDVAVGIEGADYVLTAADLGYVSKADRFHPYNNITFNEAIKIAVYALGYDMQAGLNGGYPFGYIKVAKDIGLLRNVDTSADFTVKTAYDIFYNMLHANPLIQNGYGSIVNNYESSDDPLMYTIYDVCQINGIITSTPYNSLTETNSKLSDGRIAVNGIVYVCEESRPDLLGQNCRVYCSKPDGSIDKVIYIEPYQNIECSMNLKDVDIYGDYIQSDGGKYLLKSNYGLFYNGKLEKNKTAGSYSDSQGTIRLVDNNKDGYYEYVFINDVNYIIVGNVNTENLTITDRYGYTAYDFSDKDCKYIIRDGRTDETLEINDLARGDCLAVFSSYDNKLVSMIKTGSSVTGTVSKINHEDNEVDIDGNLYFVSDYFKKNCSGIFSVGLSGSFYIGIYNDIVDIVPNNSEFKYGYLLAIDGGTNKLNTKCSMKLFTQDGEIAILSVADRPYLNGIRTQRSLSDCIKSGEAAELSAEQLIRYKIVNGEVKYIDTAEISSVDNPVTYSSTRDEADSLTKYSFDRYVYMSGSKSFVPYFSVETSTVFYIPSSMDEKKFKITNYSTFISSKNYTSDGDTIIPYDIDETCCAGAVVFKDSYSRLTYSQVNTYIVDSVGERIDDSGEEVHYVKLWYNGILNDFNVPEKSILYKPSGKMISKGDIITTYIVENEILKINVDFDSDEDVLSSASDAKFNSDQQYSLIMYCTGRVFSAGSSYIVLSYSGAKDDAVSFNPDKLRTYYLSASALNNIYVFDREEKRVYPGSVGDMKQYIAYGDDASFVVFRQSNGTIYTTLIYK